MASKFSHSRFPVSAAGSRNCVRYHQGTANGLSAGIAMLLKFAPML